MQIKIDLDDYISQELEDHIHILKMNSIPMWFYNDTEKDTLAVNHLIHCMKVVCDYYTSFDKPKYFDYSEANR